MDDRKSAFKDVGCLLVYIHVSNHTSVGHCSLLNPQVFVSISCVVTVILSRVIVIPNNLVIVKNTFRNFKQILSNFNGELNGHARQMLITKKHLSFVHLIIYYFYKLIIFVILFSYICKNLLNI